MEVNPSKSDENDGDLETQLWKHMRQTSCTEWNETTHTYDYVSVMASPETLGKVTKSVGVQLYFRLVKEMGFLFLFMFALSLPMLVFNCSGSMVDSTSALNDALGKASIANIGRCPTGGCRSDDEYEERCVFDGDCDKEDGLKVKEVSMYLGVLDGIAILAFVAFGAYFGDFRVSRVVRAFDLTTLTPADYTICVWILPKMLANQHSEYKEKLKTHFLEVLKNLEKDPVDDQEAVAKVTLVREYDGQIAEYMQKGTLLKDLANAKALKEKYSDDAKKVAAQDKAIAKIEKSIEKLDKHFEAESSIKDQDRAVCRAYVTFNKISYMNKVLSEYRFAKFSLFRLCQSEKMRFEGSRISLHQAVEPGDLYWENLDFNPYKRMARKACVLVITFLVLVVCSLLLVSIKSSTTLTPSNTYATWIIQHEPPEDSPSSNCLRICDWDMFESPACKGQSSDGWNLTQKFDLTYSQTVSPGTTGTTIGSGTNCWQSPGCGATSGSAEALRKDWYGVEFEIPREVNCMMLVQKDVSRLVRDIRVYGCDKDVLNATADRTTWKPADHCVPMQVVNPEEGSTSSGKMRILKDTSCAATIDLEVAEQAVARADDVTLNCFCTQQLIADPNLIKPPYETREQKACEQWSKDQATTYGLMVLGIVGVCVLNQVLLVIFDLLVRWERPQTVSEFTQSQLWKLFFAQFVNTGLLTYLVNLKVESIPAPLLVITEPLSIGKGAYYEANSGWFEAVGTALMITILSQVFTTTLTPPFMTKVVAPLSRWWARRSGSKVTKEALYSVYELPEWNIALRLAQTMNVICCVVFYAGGMPIMYFIGLLYCFTAYWLDKYTLLRGSKRPPAYSEDVIKLCMNFFPVAVLLHATFACFVLGNPDLLPSDWSEMRPIGELLFGVDAEEYTNIREAWSSSSSAEQSELYGDYIRTRLLDFARESTWLLMMIFLISIAYYVLIYLYALLLEPILSPIIAIIKEAFRKCGCCKGKLDSDEVETDKSYEDAVKDIKRSGIPKSYEMKDSEYYEGAATAIVHSEARISEAQVSEQPAADAPAEEAKEEEKPAEAKEEEKPADAAEGTTL